MSDVDPNTEFGANQFSVVESEACRWTYSHDLFLLLLFCSLGAKNNPSLGSLLLL